MPVLRHVFVATCPVCGAAVWTYKRAGGLPKVGPHLRGNGRKRHRPFCAGEGRVALDLEPMP